MHVRASVCMMYTFSLLLYNEFIAQKVNPRNTPIFCFSPLQMDSVICETIEI